MLNFLVNPPCIVLFQVHVGMDAYIFFLKNGKKVAKLYLLVEGKKRTLAPKERKNTKGQRKYKQLHISALGSHALPLQRPLEEQPNVLWPKSSKPEKPTSTLVAKVRRKGRRLEGTAWNTHTNKDSLTNSPVTRT